MRRVITIDGPAATGKSTAAKAVARALGFVYLDSGALYRAFALASSRQGLYTLDQQRLTELLPRWVIRAQPRGGLFRVFLDGDEVTGELRGQQIGQLASQVATVPAVRARVAEILRAVAREHDCVAEGRDMGSAVFPGATLKIYLSASVEVRARRRHRELQAKGLPSDEETVATEIAARDERDLTRSASPLRVPEGAIRIDNSSLNAAEQTRLILRFFRGGGRLRGNWFYRGTQGFVRLLLRITTGMRVRGQEHIPPGACLVACNHRSNVDPPVVASLFGAEIAILAKEELFRFAPFGRLIRIYQAMPIRRGRFDRAALRAAITSLGQGRPLLIFPEGTRHRGAGLGRPRAGVALLARETGLPVVPARVSGTGRLRQLMFRPERVELKFGRAIRHPGEGRDADAEFSARVMEAIAALPPGP